MTILRIANIKDIKYIDNLRKKEGAALGFIPKNAYLSTISNAPHDGRNRFLYSRLYITEDNGDCTGFCYVSYSGKEYGLANIFQIVVQKDARRWHRALMMADKIESDAKQYGLRGIKCRVAYDLESNFFWRAIGYNPIKLVNSTWLNQRESKSKRPLWIYIKAFDLPLFPNIGREEQYLMEKEGQIKLL